MKIMIDSDGTLRIERKNQLLQMLCIHTPFDNGGNDNYCNHHCAGFSDPVKNGNVVQIELCCKTHSVHAVEYKDLRT